MLCGTLCKERCEKAFLYGKIIVLLVLNGVLGEMVITVGSPNTLFDVFLQLGIIYGGFDVN